MVEEVVIVKVTVVNKSNKAIPIKSQFYPVFKNYKFFSPGRTVTHYPITDERIARLLSECEKAYPNLIFNITSNDIEELK